MESIARRLRVVNPDPSSNAPSPGQLSPGRKPPTQRGSGRRTRQRNARREARRKYRNECRKRFLQSEPGLPGINFSGWRGVKLLGQGGQGHAGLWVCVDDHGKIVNRMVIKETVEKEAKFNDPRIWHNGVLHGDPKEAVMNDLVTAMPEENDVHDTASNIVTIFGSSVQTDKGTYRMYQEFCAHGDLWGLVSAQKGSRRHVYKSERGETVHYSPGFSKVPEPAVWYLFLSLANACIYMEEIRVYKFNEWYPNEDMPEGTNVVHLDIKPANIFLADPWDEWFPKYPSVRVGDFGSAFLTHDHDTGNPDDYLNQPVTHGFIPPESLGHDTHGMRREGFGPWTNVHQIAMTIYAVMTGTHPHQVDYSTGGRYPPMEGLYGSYSGALIALLVLCLRPLPAERLTPRDLAKRLREDGAPHFRGMDGDRAFEIFSMSDWLHLDMQDEYVMGFAFRPPTPEAPTPQPPGLTGPIHVRPAPGGPGSEPSRGRRRVRHTGPRGPNRGSGPSVLPGVKQGSELFFTAPAAPAGSDLPAGPAPADAFTIGSDVSSHNEDVGADDVPSAPLSSFPPFGRGETVDPGAVPSAPLRRFPPFARRETVNRGDVPSAPLSSFPPFGRGETVDPGAAPSAPLSSFPPFGRGETVDPDAVPSAPVRSNPPFDISPALQPPSSGRRRRPVRGLDNFDRPYVPSVREWVSGIFSRDAPSRIPPRNPAPGASRAAGDSGTAPAGSADRPSTRELFSGLGIFSTDAPPQVPRRDRTPATGIAGAARPASAAPRAAEAGDSGDLSRFGWMANMF